MSDSGWDSAGHAGVAARLGAYVDGELPEEDLREVETHLAGCEACRREVVMQTALRARLGARRREAAPEALRERVREIIHGSSEAAVEAVSPESRSSAPARWPRALAWTGWAVAALLAGLLLWRPVGRPEPLPPVDGRPRAAADSARVPMVRDALADYRSRVGQDLPAGQGDLAEIRAQMPFPVTPLRSPEVRLISAWRTRIYGQPAAALAYRWDNRVVIQYVVPEQLFFAAAPVRQAVAEHGRYITSAGAQGVVGWPGPENGSLLIGDVPPAALTRLRS